MDMLLESYVGIFYMSLLHVLQRKRMESSRIGYTSFSGFSDPLYLWCKPGNYFSWFPVVLSFFLEGWGKEDHTSQKYISVG